MSPSSRASIDELIADLRRQDSPARSAQERELLLQTAMLLSSFIKSDSRISDAFKAKFSAMIEKVRKES